VKCPNVDNFPRDVVADDIALLSVVDPRALVTDIHDVRKFHTAPVAVAAQELTLEN
jgi:hypothetical protein